MACGQNPDRSAPRGGAGSASKADSAKVAIPPAAEAPTSGATDRGFWLSVGADTILVFKVADASHPPREHSEGDDAFRQEVARDAGSHPVLLHLVVPNHLRGGKFLHRAGVGSRELSSPSPIFRMPDSPLRTFAVVRPDAPGVLECVLADGGVGSIDLGATSRTLADLPLARDPASGFVDYGNLPRTFYGKMPP